MADFSKKLKDEMFKIFMEDSFVLDHEDQS